MARGEVDAVILGADRICANGDVVNKVGTYAHALGARAAGIPFIVRRTRVHCGPRHARPAPRWRSRTAAPAEVVGATAPAGADAVNPAFDVTPHHLVTAIVTDTRVLRP